MHLIPYNYFLKKYRLSVELNVNVITSHISHFALPNALISTTDELFNSIHLQFISLYSRHDRIFYSINNEEKK